MSDKKRNSSAANPQNQLRDVVFWGTCAALGISLASVSYFLNLTFDSLKIASIINAVSDQGNRSLVDNFTTGSIGTAKSVGSRPASRQPYPDFGTTIAVREPDFNPAEQKKSVDRLDSNIGISQQIGINLGPGNSFAALGRRYNSLADAAPTLFTSLAPKASIVEIEDGIVAHLIAGPVEDFESARRLCQKIRMRFNTICTPSQYIGQPLKVN